MDRAKTWYPVTMVRKHRTKRWMVVSNVPLGNSVADPELHIKGTVSRDGKGITIKVVPTYQSKGLFNSNNLRDNTSYFVIRASPPFTFKGFSAVPKHVI